MATTPGTNLGLNWLDTFIAKNWQPVVFDETFSLIAPSGQELVYNYYDENFVPEPQGELARYLNFVDFCTPPENKGLLKASPYKDWILERGTVAQLQLNYSKIAEKVGLIKVGKTKHYVPDGDVIYR